MHGTFIVNLETAVNFEQRRKGKMHKHKGIRKGTRVQVCGKHLCGWKGVVIKVHDKGEEKKYDVKFKLSRKGAPVQISHPSRGFKKSELRRIDKF